MSSLCLGSIPRVSLGVSPQCKPSRNLTTMLELKEKLEQLTDFNYDIELSDNALVIKDFWFYDNCEGVWSHSDDIEIFPHGDGYGIDFSDGYFPKYCGDIDKTINEIKIRL